jgi:hypothetical protein
MKACIPINQVMELPMLAPLIGPTTSQTSLSPTPFRPEQELRRIRDKRRRPRPRE